jgi:hypothetical protein
MSKTMLQGLLITTAVFVASAPAFADDGPRQRRYCGSNAVLSGTYGIQIQGTQASSPGGPTETVVGVVVRHYDGEGGFTQVSNVKGSISGIVPDRFGAGTYQVRDDCSVIVDLAPAPGVLLREQAVLVDNGNEIRSISVLPATSMVTGVQLRL